MATVGAKGLNRSVPWIQFQHISSRTDLMD